MDDIVVPDNFGDLPFSKKWDALKPALERLYLDQDLKLGDVIGIMKSRFSFQFDANESQYKYHFKKWGWKKSVPSSKKAQIVEIGQKRASIGKSTVAKYKGKEVDSKKLRRYVKEINRQPRSLGTGISNRFENPGRPTGNTIVLPHKNAIFLRWNLPYASIDLRQLVNKDHASPHAITGSTPSDVVVHTPSRYSSGSPRNAPSPFTVDLKKKTAIERANLFINGSHAELMKSMNKAERKMATSWLHQFWLFAFTTAKNWGRGPLAWTADALEFKAAEDFSPTLHSATFGITESPVRKITDSPPLYGPSDLCRWSIHVMEDPKYEAICSPPHLEENPDPTDETTWTEWPEAWHHPPFEERLTQNLASNDFTNLRLDKVSLATKHIAQAAQGSSQQMLKEPLGFSIIGGNTELVSKLLLKIRTANVDLSDMNPLHMAADHLNGARSCCNVLYEVLQKYSHPNTSYINQNGHTVLDRLMTTILKAHSNCSPGDVDETLKDETRFVGEEIDICGRWEADSDCYRKLLAKGSSRVPFSWKHKFCHTSAQGVIHCIESIVEVGLPLDTPSGLFLKYCSTCGQKMQLRPLHALLCVAWLITKAGCEEEDLFGILACLLCLLSFGISPLETAHVSLSALLHTEEPSFCGHQEMRPYRLAKMITDIALDDDSPVLRLGWRIICQVLALAEEENDSQSCGPLPYENSSRFTEDEKNELDDRLGCLEPSHVEQLHGYRKGCSPVCRRPFGKDRYLGHLWAAVKTELLNYRRLSVGDPWISKYFDMKGLLWNLENNAALTIGLFENKMIRPHCVCGEFEGVSEFCMRDEASEYYFANLDDWYRTSFIGLHAGLL